jgi:hypothetical protein
MRKECNETFLEGAKASFDFAFGLRERGNEVSDANGSQSALEMTARVEVIVRGAWTEEAQAVIIDGLGDAEALEGFAEVEEMN